MRTKFIDCYASATAGLGGGVRANSIHLNETAFSSCAGQRGGAVFLEATRFSSTHCCLIANCSAWRGDSGDTGAAIEMKSNNGSQTLVLFDTTFIGQAPLTAGNMGSIIAADYVLCAVVDLLSGQQQSPFQHRGRPQSNG